MGILEGSKGSDPSKFISEWLLVSLGEESFFLRTERAHRLPAKKGEGSKMLRNLICKMLDFRDKDLITRLSQEIPKLMCNESKGKVFSDYSLETQRQRLAYLQIKKKG